jgi:hypothetical protein
MLTRVRRLLVPVVSVVVVGLVAAPTAGAEPPSYDFATPVFGIATGLDGDLLVADFGAGIVKLRGQDGKLYADLPEVTDVGPVRPDLMWAVTGAGETENAWKLYRVFRGEPRAIADLLAFEKTFNPDGGVIESNPFEVTALPRRKALIADAAGNDLLIANGLGKVDWVATIPSEDVSTDDIKALVGCPDPIPGYEFICELPEIMPAEGVATSVAIGPDGAFYVGELKGFPAPTGESRVWRIEADAHHAECGVSPACSVVADGFTSVIDLTFGRDGTLYVVELDEASWFAVENGLGIGGTVNACDSNTWSCHEVAAGLSMPMAATVGRQGAVYVVVDALIPGLARVIVL